MQTLPTSLICLAATAALVSAPCSAVGQQSDTDPGDIVAVASAAGSFGTLLTAAKAAGLVGALQSEGPFTVLAPTDEAFAKLPEETLSGLLEPASRDKLETILRYHVIPGRVTAADALGARRATTLAGDEVVIALIDGRLDISGAKVVKNDIETSNGIIHAIDRVLIPESATSTAVTAPSAREFLELAVDLGAPLFNEGQHGACASIYELGVLSVMAHANPGLSADVLNDLGEAVQKSRADSSRRSAAWTLRRAMDRAFQEFLDSSESDSDSKAKGTNAAPAGESAANNVKSLDDFASSSAAKAWRITNDTVMGGRSKSSLTATGNGIAVFSGNVSLENNGGFASVRRPVEAGSLSDFAGIEMRVRGDGMKYRFQASNRSGVSPDVYRTDFQTRKGEWIVVRAPFADLQRNVMGYQPPNAKPLPASRVRSFGLSIGDKQQGDFELEIDWIRAYR